MTKAEVQYITGLELLALSYSGTDKLKEAIKELELLIYTRENVPF